MQAKLNTNGKSKTDKPAAEKQLTEADIIALIKKTVKTEVKALFDRGEIDVIIPNEAVEAVVEGMIPRLAEQLANFKPATAEVKG